MNLKRGLFRLWFVVSTCWVILFLAIGWSEIKRDSVWDEKPAALDETSLFLPVACEDARGFEPDNYRRATAIEPWNKFRVPASACWYRPAEFRRLWPEFAHTDSNVLTVSLYKRLGWTSTIPDPPFTQIKPVAMMVFVPPLLLLVAGCLVGWIIAGFRRPQV